MVNGKHDAKRKSKLVVTPGGPRPEEQVHFVGPNEAVRQNADGTFTIVPPYRRKVTPLRCSTWAMSLRIGKPRNRSSGASSKTAWSECGTSCARFHRRA